MEGDCAGSPMQLQHKGTNNRAIPFDGSNLDLRIIPKKYIMQIRIIMQLIEVIYITRPQVLMVEIHMATKFCSFVATLSSPLFLSEQRHAQVPGGLLRLR
jgi:hypothetical protein